jgi:hypothetical protein
VMPGLIRSQIFQEGQNGLFGLPDQASFLSCTFAGLFLDQIDLGTYLNIGHTSELECLEMNPTGSRFSKDG